MPGKSEDVSMNVYPTSSPKAASNDESNDITRRCGVLVSRMQADGTSTQSCLDAFEKPLFDDLHQPFPATAAALDHEVAADVLSGESTPVTESMLQAVQQPHLELMLAPLSKSYAHVSMMQTVQSAAEITRLLTGRKLLFEEAVLRTSTSSDIPKKAQTISKISTGSVPSDGPLGWWTPSTTASAEAKRCV